VTPDVVVVGGGPAGLAAARAASLRGLETLIAERNGRPARKLLITGKGRCNVANTADRDETLYNVVTNASFLYSALSRFGCAEIRRLLEGAGVPTKVERGGRVFPESDRAADVARALERLAREAGARVMTGARVESVAAPEGAVESVRLCGGETVRCRSVILCTGGESYPATGSTGDGYRIARALGHSITPLRPALVAISLKDPFVADLEGLSLKNVQLSLLRKGKTVFSELGEMLFTEKGISGPLALSASSHMKQPACEYAIELDMKPGLDLGRLDRRLLRDFGAYSNRQFNNALGDLLPGRLIPVCIRFSGVDPLKPVHQVTAEERARLAGFLKRWRLLPEALGPIKEAIVTGGGVRVREVDPKTMESRLVSGLHFAGEVLDVDALTGGYNLTIALSTGHAAGSHCLGGTPEETNLPN